MLDLSTLSAYLGTDLVADTPDAVRALGLEAGAVAELETATGRLFREADTVTDYRNGTEEQALELRCPVASGTPAVYINGSTTALAADRFEIRTHPKLGVANILFLKWSRWPYGEGNVRVVYDGGYDEFPADVLAYVGRRTAQLFVGTPVAVSGGGQSTGELALPDDLAAIVQRWYLSPGLYSLPLVLAS